MFPLCPSIFPVLFTFDTGSAQTVSHIPQPPLLNVYAFLQVAWLSLAHNTIRDRWLRFVTGMSGCTLLPPALFQGKSDGMPLYWTALNAILYCPTVVLLGIQARAKSLLLKLIPLISP